MAAKDAGREAQVQVQAQAQPKPGLKELLPKLLLFGFVFLDLGIVGGSTYLIYLAKLGYQRPAITEESETQHLSRERELFDDHPVLFTFEPFTVNLDGKPRKLVQTTIQLEMLSDEGYEEAVQLTPVTRDKIVKILNSKKVEEIDTIQGKLFLKDQILTALNQVLHKGSVKEVYFNDFVIQ